ncbi:MAG: glycoside hydrolase family 3 protein [Desulfomonile tiedjei]|nr:glycoside hydrolase family 3 protein [Desulfomonile tiedjei]
MRLSFAVLKLLIALALLPVALDWRSPLLVDVRVWALAGLIASTLLLILAEIWALRSSRPEQRAVRAINVLGLLVASVALGSTLYLEARFNWARYQVLHAEPNQLEKLGRHVIVGYRSLGEVRELVRLRAVAGIFLSGHNVRGKSAGEIRKQIQSLQRIRKEQGLPRLWIATDQEGGIVSRLSPPLSSMPALSEIVEGASDTAQREEAVRRFAGTQGRELADVGVNLNFAPVVDLNHELNNPDDKYTRISQRAISSDPAVVTRVAAWYCAALEEAGVRCTLKHFPGLGRVLEDTHLNHANLRASPAELSTTDWVPFRTLMNQTGAFTMLGHVRLTAVDSDLPASISQRVITGILREAWKHDGVLITDDFGMRAIYHSSAGIQNGSIEALNAGVDLVLISWDPDQYYFVMYALLKADQQGRLNREVLGLSDQRLAKAIQTIRQ